MTSRYKILFAINLLNDYYKESICNDFTAVPSATTATLLKNYGLLYKAVGNKLLVLIKVDDTGVPLININADAKFVFYLSLSKPEFINFTNVDIKELSTKRFWFSNINQNKSNGLLNISAIIPKYVINTLYNTGAFAGDNTNTVFEALEATSADTSNTLWVARGKNQFVSLKDMIVPSQKIFNYTASSANTNFLVTVYSFNKATNNYDAVVKIISLKYKEATNNIHVDLSALPAGKYHISINADEPDLYIDDAFTSNNYFGVIEIFAHLPNTNEFSFFKKIAVYDNTKPYVTGNLADDGSGNISECLQNTTGNNTLNLAFWKPRQNVPGILREVNYSIHFANRRAFWKYISALNKIDNIKIKDTLPADTPFSSFSSDPDNHPARKDFFISNNQLLISEKTDENNFQLILNAPLDSYNPVASKPDLGISGMLTKQNEIFYCNIYLNY